jgi:hypothetical protein
MYSEVFSSDVLLSTGAFSTGISEAIEGRVFRYSSRAPSLNLSLSHPGNTTVKIETINNDNGARK